MDRINRVALVGMMALAMVSISIGPATAEQHNGLNIAVAYDLAKNINEGDTLGVILDLLSFGTAAQLLLLIATATNPWIIALFLVAHI